MGAHNTEQRGEERQATEREPWTENDLSNLLVRLGDAAIAHEVCTGRGSLWGDAADAIVWLHGPRHAAVNALGEALRHFAHLDESNAAIHCGTVRYSPITFRLANALGDMGAADGLAAAVLGDMGTYEEDRGR